jgi:hypothetical protein
MTNEISYIIKVKELQKEKLLDEVIDQSKGKRGDRKGNCERSCLPPGRHLLSTIRAAGVVPDPGQNTFLMEPVIVRQRHDFLTQPPIRQMGQIASPSESSILSSIVFFGKASSNVGQVKPSSPHLKYANYFDRNSDNSVRRDLSGMPSRLRCARSRKKAMGV